MRSFEKHTFNTKAIPRPMWSMASNNETTLDKHNLCFLYSIMATTTCVEAVKYLILYLEI